MMNPSLVLFLFSSERTHHYLSWTVPLVVPPMYLAVPKWISYAPMMMSWEKRRRSRLGLVFVPLDSKILHVDVEAISEY